MPSVNSWCKSHRLKHLGVPMFLGSGSFEHGSAKLRFLVMERFGKDVDELFVSSGRRFDITTVFMLGLRVVSTIFCYYNDYNQKSNEVTQQYLLILWNTGLQKQLPFHDKNIGNSE